MEHFSLHCLFRHKAAPQTHTESTGRRSPHFMRATNSSLIARSGFRAVEGAFCVWPVQIEDTAFCLATQESGLMTSGASVQQQQVCSRAIGTPPQGMSAAVFESTSSRVVCRSIWHNTWYAMCVQDGHLLSHPIFLHRFRGTSTVMPR